MSVAAANPAAAPFNITFYSVAATLIPLLFISIAIEGRLIRDLIAATFAAAISGAELVQQQFERTPGDPDDLVWKDQTLSRRQRLGVMARAVFLNWIAGIAPGILAITIVVLATASEITALTALYGRAAQPWMGPLILTGAILLTTTAAIPPAAGIVRALREQMDILEQAGLLDEPEEDSNGPAAAPGKPC